MKIKHLLNKQVIHYIHYTQCISFSLAANFSKKLFILLIFLLLHGCSSFINNDINHDNTSKNNNQVELNQWSINGKLGVKTKTEQVSTSLTWIQNYDDFDIRFSGPLGYKASTIRGNQEYAVLNLAGEGEFRSESPEKLLQEKTRINFPVKNLLSWIKGKPNSINNSEDIKRLKSGKIKSFTEDNWKVNFTKFTTEKEIQLPTKIILKKEDIILTIIIKKWQI